MSWQDIADAAIEVVGLPFSFRPDEARVVAITGRDVRVTARDSVPAWTSLFVRAGDVVTITGTARSRYTYVAVSGGITTDVLLGSRSVYRGSSQASFCHTCRSRRSVVV